MLKKSSSELMRLEMRIDRFINGFLAGMIFGIVLFIIFLLTTGVGGRDPAPENNPALLATENTETTENLRRVDNMAIAHIPGLAGIGSAGLRLVATGRPAENDSALLATESTEFTEDIKIGRINDITLLTGRAGPSSLPPAAGPNIKISQATRLDKQVGDGSSYLADQSFQSLATESTEDTEIIWLDELIERIWQQESSGQLSPPDGDDGKAIGPLQIHPEALKDINEKFDTDFTVEDCRDITKAKVIAKLYISLWMDIHKEEIAARIFNGGPRGWEKESTIEYWQKIEAQRQKAQRDRVYE